MPRYWAQICNAYLRRGNHQQIRMCKARSSERPWRRDREAVESREICLRAVWRTSCRLSDVRNCGSADSLTWQSRAVPTVSFAFRLHGQSSCAGGVRCSSVVSPSFVSSVQQQQSSRSGGMVGMPRTVQQQSTGPSKSLQTIREFIRPQSIRPPTSAPTVRPFGQSVNLSPLQSLVVTSGCVHSVVQYRL